MVPHALFLISYSSGSICVHVDVTTMKSHKPNIRLICLRRGTQHTNTHKMDKREEKKPIVTERQRRKKFEFGLEHSNQLLGVLVELNLHVFIQAYSGQNSLK